MYDYLIVGASLYGVVFAHEAKKAGRSVLVIDKRSDVGGNVHTKLVYEKLIKGYTEKQWGRDCKELPASIIKRLPVRLTFDNDYFNAKYQGIPVGGYKKMVERMLDGVEVRLNEDYFFNKEEYDKLADKIIYTGAIDTYFNFCLGNLEYRSVRFETEILDTANYQGNAVINYTDQETPFTRIIEHKWFEFEIMNFIG